MLKKLFAIDKKILIFIGVFAGIIISAVTAKTFAYTDSADFCQSCHIMTSVHESFTDSTHAKLACNDCHLPHETQTGKLTFKAKAGLNHMYYNTLGSEKIPDVLLATERSAKVINQNCVDCHESTVDNVSHDAKDSCTSCHQEIPHGKGFKTENFYKPPKSGELLENKGGTLNNG
ncbi:NapC/NirT family cytochrome c [Bacillus sp. FJAT-29790]|uniref:cytochrome c3 family protein n=1 Tax=Bacillus sp. FJAT-29790 TaxID=1895002 RepID=UPI001C23269F|nr:NapC/NirT family cytochrome c [Bacillus sp. FJAT-29790]MBU8879816.1 NapC/NirT family cytochrome c [Bacillus sp. FJAT-29790]